MSKIKNIISSILIVSLSLTTISNTAFAFLLYQQEQLSEQDSDLEQDVLDVHWHAQLHESVSNHKQQSELVMQPHQNELEMQLHQNELANVPRNLFDLLQMIQDQYQIDRQLLREI